MTDWDFPQPNQSLEVSLYQIASALQKIADTHSALKIYVEELDDNIRDLQEEIEYIKEEIEEIK